VSSAEAAIGKVNEAIENAAAESAARPAILSTMDLLFGG
jgi:hypothetical protein